MTAIFKLCKVNDQCLISVEPPALISLGSTQKPNLLGTSKFIKETGRKFDP